MTWQVYFNRLMKLKFTKMSGAGNDFVVIDNRTGIIPDPQTFSKMVCDRRFGIGADGLLMLESSSIADFTMKYYNADGSNAGMCGNGGRCLSKYAFDVGIISNTTFTFEGFGHIYKGYRISEDEYELVMMKPFNIQLQQELDVNGSKIIANYVNTGTDHCVIFLDDNPDLGSLESVNVIEIGKKIRYHNQYRPIGTNVNFVHIKDINCIQIRTYERGVEDETLACGTGSVASAILSNIKYGFSGPISINVRSGESLTVKFNKIVEGYSNVRLQGGAKITFRGELDI
jgi:diaminopimelate epimerase